MAAATIMTPRLMAVGGGALGELPALMARLGLKHALIVLGEGEETFFRAARNLAAHKVLLLAGLNVYDLLNYDEVLMTEQVARAIEARLKGEAR